MRAHELLNEYKASPGALRSLAKNINAIAGFEMEMASNLGSDHYDQIQPDMGMDESAHDISDITRFFNDGDLNSRRDIDDLAQEMYDDYQQWRLEESYAAWHNESDKREIVKKYILENEYTYLDFEELWLAAFRDDNPGADEPTDDIVDNAVHEMLDNLIDESVKQENEHYENAKTEWQDEWLENESNGEEFEWLRHVGITRMSDVPDNYSIEWPYYTRDGEVDRDEIATEIKYVVGRRAMAAGFLAGHPDNTYLVVEDSSVRSDDGDEDAGFEIVSPPLPPYEMLDDYRKITKWAISKDYTTNDTTGLHMNVSIVGYNENDLDYVKLALLLGEEYMANIYDRFDTWFAQSAIKKLNMRASYSPEMVEKLLVNMRSGLSTAAIEMFHNGWTDKNTSINPHDGRVEFRFPGGDYLAIDDKVIEATLMRCIVALDAACDPNKFRKEYLKKLYKLIAPHSYSNRDGLEVFVKYSAGMMPKAALKSFIKQQRADKERTKQQQGTISNIKDNDVPQVPDDWDAEDDSWANHLRTKLAGLGDGASKGNWATYRGRIGKGEDA